MEDRNGFSHNFKSPVGKQRRPACPVWGTGRSLTDRKNEDGTVGTGLKGTVWPHRGCHRLLDWGRRCEYKPLPDRLGRQWQK